MLVHQLINEERTKAGLNTLEWDDKIAALAQQHSEEMAANNYFEHESLDGKTPHQRSIANGVCIYAENIIQGGSYYGEFSNDDIARKAVQGWMESEGHRHNILGQHSQEGIGAAYDKSGTKMYITQDFC